MATYFTRKNTDAALRALVKAFNALHDSVAGATGASGNGAYHHDITSVPTGDYTNPSSTAVAFATTVTTNSLDGYCANGNELLGILKVHFADDYSHNKVDATNQFVAAFVDGYCTTAAKLYAFCNQAKAAYNAHCAQSGVHYNNDSSNTISATDATTLATAGALLAEMFIDVAVHMASGPATGKVRWV